MMVDGNVKLLIIGALFITGLLCAWVALACRRAARRQGLPAYDVAAWALLSVVFLLYSQMQLAKSEGLLIGLGPWLRFLAREHGFYAGRRPFQITATIAVGAISISMLLYGLIWIRHQVKRYRLAIGFTAVALGFAIIRFISLHEVDGWNAARPFARETFDLIGAAGTSAVAIVQLWQLRKYAALRRKD